MSELQELNVSGFGPSYSVVIDPEFLGDGDWGCDVFAFGRDGRLEEPFHSVWGTPFVVEVRPQVLIVGWASTRRAAWAESLVPSLAPRRIICASWWTVWPT